MNNKLSTITFAVCLDIKIIKGVHFEHLFFLALKLFAKLYSNSLERLPLL